MVGFKSEGRTVRRSVEKLSRDDFASDGLHDVKGGRSAPQTLSLSRDVISLCSECLNGGQFSKSQALYLHLYISCACVVAL